MTQAAPTSQPTPPTEPDMITPEEIEKWTPAQQREVANSLKETATFLANVTEEDLRKIQSLPWEKLQQPADPKRPLTEEDKEAYREMYQLIENGVVTMAQVLGYSEEELYKIYSTGQALSNQGRHEEALKLAEGLLFLIPKFLPAYLLQGEAYRQLGKLDEALSAYNKAVSADPTLVEVYFERAKLFFSASNIQLFLMDIESIAQLDPEARTPYGKRARKILEMTEKELMAQGLTAEQIAEAEKQLLQNMVDMPADMVPDIDKDGNQLKS